LKFVSGGNKGEAVKIEMSKAHKLDDREAKRRVENLRQELSKRYGLTCAWNGEKRLEFSRTGVKGEVVIQAGQVNVWVELALLLTPLKPQVELQLKEKLEKEFA
jgi:putative polyhydroxyalkanoate system protein